MNCPLEQMAKDHERDVAVMKSCTESRIVKIGIGDKIYFKAAWALEIGEMMEAFEPYPLREKYGLAQWYKDIQ